MGNMKFYLVETTAEIWGNMDSAIIVAENEEQVVAPLN
jgi:hypothetical protein